MTNKALLFALLLVTAPSFAFASSLDLGVYDTGISFGNSKVWNGLRFNLVDDSVEVVCGYNITLWKPGKNPDFRMAGIAIGLVAPDAALIEGIAIGGVGVSGGEIQGVAIGTIGVGGDRLRGLFVGGLGVGGDNMAGAFFTPGGIGGDSVSGLALAGLYNTSKESFAGFGTGAVTRMQGDMTGLTIAIVNIARHLNGAQIGVVNYAGNNPGWSKVMPVMNVHLD